MTLHRRLFWRRLHPRSEAGDAAPTEPAEITVPDEVAEPVEAPVEVTTPHV